MDNKNSSYSARGLASRVQELNADHDRVCADSAALQDLVKQQAEMLAMLKEQAEASKKESRKTTLVIVLTAIGAICAVVSLLLTSGL